MVGKEKYKILPNVKYEIKEGLDFLVFSSGAIPFIFSLKEECENVLHINKGIDSFYFLFPIKYKYFSSKFIYKGKEITINNYNDFKLIYGGEVIITKDSLNMEFSHYEIDGDLCLIFFKGERNYLIILQNKEILFDNYYDECNIDEKEKYFMCKLFDSLNHGRVAHIKESKFDSYLIYLDNNELKLNNEFLPHVFLDCVLAKNYSYANELLSEEIKLKNKDNIGLFFNEFDYFYPLSLVEYVLIKKNTLAGICEFEIKNNKICNIINH